jgi:D-alanine transaminase
MHTIPDTLCYLDGEYGPLRDAKVSVMDRGFLFGDGIYEAIPVYARRLFLFDQHMDRLDRSLSKVRIENPLGRAQWLECFRKLAAAHPDEDHLIYLQVTRGVAPRNHVMPADLAPTVFVMTLALAAGTPEQRHQGIPAVTARDFRWQRGDIKTISLMGAVLARAISADQGAQETIMLRDGWLTEGSACNVWVVHEGALLGPPKSEDLLEGIRYELLRQLCEEEGIAFNLRPIAEADLSSADEILISSAGRELLAVTTLDGQPVGHGALRGRPGPVYGRLAAAYERAKTLLAI